MINALQKGLLKKEFDHLFNLQLDTVAPGRVAGTHAFLQLILQIIPTCKHYQAPLAACTTVDPLILAGPQIKSYSCSALFLEANKFKGPKAEGRDSSMLASFLQSHLGGEQSGWAPGQLRPLSKQQGVVQLAVQ